MSREYLVIEDSAKAMVFSRPEQKVPKGYIPRDVAEGLLRRDLSGTQWFTAKESEQLRAHPEWLDKWPETTGSGDSNG